MIYTIRLYVSVTPIHIALLEITMACGRVSTLGAIVLGLMMCAGSAAAQTLGSSFSYQGRLGLDGLPVEGTVDLEFRLFTLSSGGTQVGSTVSRNAWPVVAGEVMTAIDFGTAVFDGQERYLEVSVRSPAGSTEPFVVLNPRQRLSPAPYALVAKSLVPGANLAIGAVTNAHTPLTFQNTVGPKISLWGSATQQFGMGIQNSLMQFYTDSSNSDFAFGTGSSGTFTERMRIEGTGNVGIGTSTPGAKLDVAGTGRFTGLQLTGNGAAAGRFLASDAQGLASWVAAPSGTQWSSSGNNISYSTGNVGLGTSTPGTKLDVVGTGRFTAFQLTGNGAAAGRVLSSDAQGLASWIAPPSSQWTTGGSNISFASGNVGIGTAASTTSRLDVNGETRSTTFEVANGVIQKGGALPATTDLGLYSLNNGQWLRLVSNSAAIQFFTNSAIGSSAAPAANTAAMTVDPNGNVGIGISSPPTKLNVVGAIRYSSDLTAQARTFDITSGAAIDLIANSDIYINSNDGRRAILLNTNAGAGNVGIGTNNPTEKLHVNGNIRANILIIDGGADLAESYDVAPASDTKPIPGMVVCIDPDQVGKLRIATSAYDRTVAGIISGADGIAPGLILGQKGTVADGEHPIANAGRVWCYVDADAGGPIVPGDLLTTSATPGHAMRASDSARASGAIMGKAMSRLETGRGLVLVLVSLQ